MGQTYSEASRSEWSRRDGGQPNLDEMKFGCLQRIALALEKIAKRVAHLDPDEKARLDRERELKKASDVAYEFMRDSGRSIRAGLRRAGFKSAFGAAVCAKYLMEAYERKEIPPDCGTDLSSLRHQIEKHVPKNLQAYAKVMEMYEKLDAIDAGASA